MRVNRILATTAVLMAATVCLVWLWSLNLDAVPRPPAGFWIWLGNLLDLQNDEDLLRLHAAYTVIVSYFFVSVGAVVAWLIVRKLRLPPENL